MRPRSLAPTLEFASFRRENAVLILLNLGVMLGLLGLHFIFRPVLGAMSMAGALALGGRFLLQLGELAWMSHPSFQLGPDGTRIYAWATVLVHLGFAFLLSWIGPGQESHYVVLLVIPVIASAFWFTWPGLVCTVLGASLLTILQVWVPLGLQPQGRVVEYFEATTVALIFVLVAIVARILARRLWDREAALRASLAELDRTRDQLVREARLAAIGRLSSAIAHEIRNPVAMIASSAQAAERPGTPEAARTACLGIVAQESRRLERLTGDFLAYARNRPVERRIVALSVVLGAAAGLARAQAEERGLVLEVAMEEDVPVELDPFQAQQALLNLLANALDAVALGGRVVLGGSAGPDGVCLWVEDDGPAVPPAILEHLGEPFHSTKPAGTGLGLAIVHAIAEAHGGRLWIPENRPGRVRFELDLPRTDGAMRP
ncbi:MAG TPA: ATP-binding protein [Holophagaceae bacterium]